MTLFPDMVMNVLGESIIGRAAKSGIIEVFAHNIRDYSKDKHRKTDDTPFGGGVGMVMTCQPIYDCYLDIKSKLKEDANTRVVYMTPKGRLFSHEVAKELSEYDNLIFLCGHYEGVDQRIIDEIVDEEISIGDYVVTSKILVRLRFYNIFRFSFVNQQAGRNHISIIIHRHRVVIMTAAWRVWLYIPGYFFLRLLTRVQTFCWNW